MGHTAEPDSGMKRAAEVTDAMLGVPGYADDSMFFTVRYGHRAKVAKPVSLIARSPPSPSLHDGPETAEKHRY